MNCICKLYSRISDYYLSWWGSVINRVAQKEKNVVGKEHTKDT